MLPFFMGASPDAVVEVGSRRCGRGRAVQGYVSLRFFLLEQKGTKPLPSLSRGFLLKWI